MGVRQLAVPSTTATSTMATLAGNVANARPRMARPGSSSLVGDPALATLAGGDGRRWRGRTEGIKGSSLGGEPTTVEVAVTTTANTMATTMATTTATTTANTITANTTTANTTMATTTDNTTMDNTTTDSAVDLQMEVVAGVTTGSPSETSTETPTEPANGRTTPDEAGATQLDGGTRDAEICKRQSGFPTTPGLTRPVGIMDRMDFFEGIKLMNLKGNWPNTEIVNVNQSISKLLNILQVDTDS